MANPVELVGGVAIGTGVGAAVGASVTPKLQEYINEQWAKYPHRPPSAGTLAVGVAQGQVSYADALAWARATGFDKAQFDALVNIANTGPGVAEAFRLHWRGEIGEEGFKRALRRQGIEQEWIDDLWRVRENVLDPAVIANAVHRGIMRDPSLIVREPPTTAGKVEQVPPSPLDPVTEAAGSGINHERLRVEVGTTGLPPGLIQMLQLLNRGEVTVADVQRAVSQSNLRNEYMDVVLALKRQLLTPHEYEEAALRGIMSQDDADKGAALHGMEKADARLLFDIMGRPLVVHQITTGLARGGKFGGTYTDVPEPYRDAIRRSNIRPEYARLAYANRYSYPSAFVLRALAEAGDLGNTAAVQQILEEIGWSPSLAGKVAPKWAPSGTAADPHVSKAQTQLWNTTHTSYKAQEIDDATATAALPSAGVATSAIPDILAIWAVERSLIRAQLSPSDVRKGYQAGAINAATGNKWTRDEALAALLDRGWGITDSNDYLNISYKG